MATPRRPQRPSRPGQRTTRRAAEPPPEAGLDDEEPIEELEPEKQGPSVPVMVGVGAGLLFAGIVAMMVFDKSDFPFEVESTSENNINAVVVKVNGESYDIGDLTPREIGRARIRRTPGSDLVVTYRLPFREGTIEKRVPQKDLQGEAAIPDFGEFKGTFRIRLSPDGVTETIY